MEEASQELATIVAGAAGVYDQTGAVRRVAEAGPVAPMDKDALEWRSLWE